MNPYTALAVFAAYFVLGMLYALFVKYTNRRDAFNAANCSVVISFLMTTSIMQCLTNPMYLLPMLMGNWLGTYVAISPQRHLRRISMFRFFTILTLFICFMVLSASQAEARYFRVRCAGVAIVRGTAKVVLPPYPALGEAGSTVLGVERRQVRRSQRCGIFGGCR